MKQRPTLLFVTNNGMPIRCFWQPLLHHLQKNWRVVLCIPEPDAHTQALAKKLDCKLVAWSLDPKGCKPWRDMASLASLITIMRQEKPHAVVASTIKAVIWAGFARKIVGIPHFFALITGLGYCFEADSFFKKCLHTFSVFLYRHALRGASRVFFQNEDDKNVFLQNNIISPHTPIALTAGTGVDIQHFSPAPPVLNEPVFLFVGRLLVAKGLHEMYKAASKLKKQYPQARFCLLGEIQQGAGALSEAILRAWQASGNIEYWGACRDVRPFLAQASVVLLPSWREGMPVSILEAMAMARPVVVSDCAGCKDCIEDGVQGFIVPCKDVAALANALERFIQQPEHILSMGKAARQRVCLYADADCIARKISLTLHKDCFSAQ